MKTLSLIFLSFALAGCAPKPDPLAARLTALEAQCLALQIALSNQSDHVAEVDSKVVKWQATADAGLAKIETTFHQLQSSANDMVAMIEDHIADTNPHSPRIRYVAVPPGGLVKTAPASVPRLIEGIPASTYNAIKAKIQAKYPTDFYMQRVLIDSEVESYKRVNL